MKIGKHVVVAAIAAGCCAAAAQAHHSNAQFDRGKVVKLNGTVRDYQWTNPHIWIELDVPSAKGAVHYSIEGPSPSILRKKGWKFNSMKAGDKALVVMHPLKSGEMGGGVMAVTVNGTTLDYEPPVAGG